jgi:hypothetical protein
MKSTKQPVSLSLNLNSSTPSHEIIGFKVLASSPNPLISKGNSALIQEVLSESKLLHQLHRRLFSSETSRTHSRPGIFPAIGFKKHPSVGLTVFDLEIPRVTSIPSSSASGSSCSVSRRVRQESRPNSNSMLYTPRELEADLKPITRTKIYMLEDIFSKPGVLKRSNLGGLNCSLLMNGRTGKPRSLRYSANRRTRL